MNLRREYGSFSLSLDLAAETSVVITIPKSLKPEEFIGAIITDGAEYASTIVSVKTVSNYNLLALAAVDFDADTTQGPLNPTRVYYNPVNGKCSANPEEIIDSFGGEE